MALMYDSVKLEVGVITDHCQGFDRWHIWLWPGTKHTAKENTRVYMIYYDNNKTYPLYIVRYKVNGSEVSEWVSSVF